MKSNQCWHSSSYPNAAWIFPGVRVADCLSCCCSGTCRLVRRSEPRHASVGRSGFCARPGGVALLAFIDTAENFDAAIGIFQGQPDMGRFTPGPAFARIYPTNRIRRCFRMSSLRTSPAKVTRRRSAVSSEAGQAQTYRVSAA